MSRNRIRTRLLGELLTLEYGSGLRSEARTGEGFPVLGSSGIVGRHSHYQVHGPGIVIGRKGTVGAVSWSSQAFWPIDTTYYVVAKEPLDLRWCYWLLTTLPLKRLDSSTGVPGLNRNDVYRIAVDVPSLPEQRRIAEILDTIDDAIQATEALIAKLRQTRAGLLHDLLTRGIDEHGHLRDPDAHPEQFKDSPLGRIPREWTILNLGSIASVESGITLGRRIPDGPGTLQLPYLRVANVQDGYIDLSEIKTIRVYRSEVERYSLRRGDVLMNEGGDFDKLGRGAVWNGQIDECLHQNHVFRVRVDQTALRPEFLAAVSGSSIGKRYFVLSSKQTTNLASINSTQLRAFPIPVPERDEQDRILASLSAMDASVQSEQVHSTKLQVMKQGLMGDLLTGHVPAHAIVEAEFSP